MSAPRSVVKFTAAGTGCRVVFSPGHAVGHLSVDGELQRCANWSQRCFVVRCRALGPASRAPETPPSVNGCHDTSMIQPCECLCLCKRVQRRDCDGRTQPADRQTFGVASTWLLSILSRPRQSPDDFNDPLKTIRQEREALRETAETARMASEEASVAAEAARQAVVNTKRATADSLNASLEQMRIVEEMRRRTLRDRRHGPRTCDAQDFDVSRWAAMNGRTRTVETRRPSRDSTRSVRPSSVISLLSR